jgi:hypothetical protein
MATVFEKSTGLYSESPPHPLKNEKGTENKNSSAKNRMPSLCLIKAILDTYG